MKWAELIIAALGLAADIAARVGDAITAQRVEAIITERFPEFPRRAAAASQAARDTLGGGPGGPAPT